MIRNVNYGTLWWKQKQIVYWQTRNGHIQAVWHNTTRRIQYPLHVANAYKAYEPFLNQRGESDCNRKKQEYYDLNNGHYFEEFSNLNQHPQQHIFVLKHNKIREQIAQENTHT